MKLKRTLAVLLASAMALLFLSACSGSEKSEKYSALQIDADGTATISAQDISADARFFNYDADGVTVQLVALRDKTGGLHLAFNTCQSCSPSPKAFYRQNGAVLQCENCGFTFAPEQVGITHGGCNPWPISGLEIGESEIRIPESSLDSMRSVFETWEGPTK